MTYKPIEGMMNAFDDGLYDSVWMNRLEKIYDEKEKLGEGSFGVVFRWQVRTNKNYSFAIKKIKFKAKNKEEIRKELEMHSLVLRIKHENIVKIEEFWIENSDINTSTLHFRMELCDISLDDFLKKFYNELKITEIHFKYYISSEILIQILEGVKCLHEFEPKIIHRDLRPDNILMMLDHNNRVFAKIADFGLVTIHKYAQQLHQQDLGQLRYMALELDTDQSVNYDTKADIYSLGIVLGDLFDINFYEIGYKFNKDVFN